MRLLALCCLLAVVGCGPSAADLKSRLDFERGELAKVEAVSSGIREELMFWGRIKAKQNGTEPDAVERVAEELIENRTIPNEHPAVAARYEKAMEATAAARLRVQKVESQMAAMR